VYDVEVRGNRGRLPEEDRKQWDLPSSPGLFLSRLSPRDGWYGDIRTWLCGIPTISTPTAWVTGTKWSLWIIITQGCKKNRIAQHTKEFNKTAACESSW